MDAVKSVRLPEDLARAVRERARRERVDESTALRQLLGLGAQEYAVRLYREGRITLGEAARLAGLTPRDTLDLLWDRGVRGNVTLDQQRRALAFARESAPEETGPA